MVKKKRYIVASSITISVHTEVEASSRQEAKRLAGDRSVVSLCHQCARGNPAEEWSTSGELDGEPDPSDYTVEEA